FSWSALAQTLPHHPVTWLKNLTHPLDQQQVAGCGGSGNGQFETLGKSQGGLTMRRCLPITEEKKSSDLVETSLICLLSGLVAVLGFLLVWLIGMLAGFGRG